MDADWDALGQAHTREDGIHSGNLLLLGCAFETLIARAILSNVAAHDLAVAHQLDLG